MSKEANRGEREHRAKHYKAPALTMDQLVPGLFAADPYDLAHPSNIDPHGEDRPEISEFKRQLISVRKRSQAHNPNVCPPSDQPTTIAPCVKCGHWPCLEVAGCPDYQLLSKGVFWLPKLHRFETDAEAIEAHTIKKGE